jgi:MoaA/NifB/PqqE/SkfB family radical SAM enzyme
MPMGFTESWRRAHDRYRLLVPIAPPLKPAAAYLNWARANWEMWRQTSTIRAKPLKLTFDPTNVCQLRCPLCPTGLGIQDRDRSRARLHIFEHLMEEIGDELFFIDFYNWGEPLLNKHLEGMIEIATGKGIMTAMSSNLSLPLTDERARRLVGSGLGELICSLDGASQAPYAAYRRKGNFELAVENLRRLVRAKRELGSARPTIIWRFYVFRFNEHEIDRAREMAQEIGVDRFVLGTPYLGDNQFHLSEADDREARSWAATDPAYNRYHPSHPEYVDPDRPVEVRKRCDWHYVSTAVNPDGGVAPCCAVFEKAHDFGDLELPGDPPGAASYMDVVNNPSFVAIRDRFAGRRAEPTGLVCEQCPTPDIMSYGRIMNRHIAFLTFVSLVNTVRRLGRRRPEPWAVAPSATAPVESVPAAE